MSSDYKPVFNEGFAQGIVVRKEVDQTKNGKPVTTFGLRVKKSYVKPGDDEDEVIIFKAYGKSHDKMDPVNIGAKLKVMYELSCRENGIYVNYGIMVKYIHVIQNGVYKAKPAPATQPVHRDRFGRAHV